MSDSNGQALSRVYELIESDRLAEARAELKLLLNDEKDNPDFWWLYIHAVDDPNKARKGLERLMELDPDYPGARDMAPQLGVAVPSSTAVAEEPLIPLDSEFDDDDLELDDEDIESSESVERGRLLRILLLVGIIALLLVLVFLLLRPGDDEDDDTSLVALDTPAATLPLSTAAVEPTEDVVAPEVTPEVVIEITPEVTPEDVDIDTEPERIEVEETIEASSAIPTSDFSTLVTALSGRVELFSDTGDILDVEDFGQTLFVSVCSDMGDALRETVDEVMAAAADESSNMPEDIDAIGVRLIDCADGTTINSIVVNRADAQDMADGVLDEETYRSRWRAIG